MDQTIQPRMTNKLKSNLLVLVAQRILVLTKFLKTILGMSVHPNLQKNLQKAAIRLTPQLYSLSEMDRTLHLKTTRNLTKNPAMNLILLFHNHLNKIVMLWTHS